MENNTSKPHLQVLFSIPGKEVYWDYETAKGRKGREDFGKEFEESDSSIAKHNDATPKLIMVAEYFQRGR